MKIMEQVEMGVINFALIALAVCLLCSSSAQAYDLYTVVARGYVMDETSQELGVFSSQWGDVEFTDAMGVGGTILKPGTFFNALSANVYQYTATANLTDGAIRYGVPINLGDFDGTAIDLKRYNVKLTVVSSEMKKTDSLRIMYDIGGEYIYTERPYAVLDAVDGNPTFTDFGTTRQTAIAFDAQLFCQYTFRSGLFFLVGGDVKPLVVLDFERSNQPEGTWFIPGTSDENREAMFAYGGYGHVGYEKDFISWTGGGSIGYQYSSDYARDEHYRKKRGNADLVEVNIPTSGIVIQFFARF